MKTHLVRVSMLVLGAAAVWAQNPYPLKADVPFDFNVSGVTMPAGRYLVLQDTIAGVIRLQAEEAGKQVVVGTVPTETGTPPLQAQLVFRRYGGQYFLAETWTPGSNLGRLIPPSKQERLLADGGRTPNRTVLAAK